MLMNRIVTLCLAFLLVLSAHGQKLKLTVDTPGTLSQQLSSAQNTTSVVLSGTLDGSDLRALRSLPHLQTVDLRKVKNLTLPDSSFFGMTHLEQVRLPRHLQRLGVSAFEGCINLHYVQCPPTLVAIPDRMFFGCMRLDRLDILHSSITHIGSAAFMQSAIRLMPLPKLLTSIGSLAFAGCDHLERVVLPMWVGSVGSMAFAHCLRLCSIVVLSDNPPACAADAFEGLDACTLHVRHPEFFRDREPWNALRLSYQAYNGSELQSFDQTDINDLKQNLRR